MAPKPGNEAARTYTYVYTVHLLHQGCVVYVTFANFSRLQLANVSVYNSALF